MMHIPRALALLVFLGCAGQALAAEPAKDPAAASQPKTVSGTVTATSQEPNVVGARCGFHYAITMTQPQDGPFVFFIYDMSAPPEAISALVGKRIEADVNDRRIAKAVRMAASDGGAGKLASLDDRRFC